MREEQRFQIFISIGCHVNNKKKKSWNIGKCILFSKIKKQHLSTVPGNQQTKFERNKCNKCRDNYDTDDGQTMGKFLFHELCWCACSQAELKIVKTTNIISKTSSLYRYLQLLWLCNFLCLLGALSTSGRTSISTRPLTSPAMFWSTQWMVRIGRMERLNIMLKLGCLPLSYTVPKINWLRRRRQEKWKRYCMFLYWNAISAQMPAKVIYAVRCHFQVLLLKLYW